MLKIYFYRGLEQLYNAPFLCYNAGRYWMSLEQSGGKRDETD